MTLITFATLKLLYFGTIPPTFASNALIVMGLVFDAILAWLVISFIALINSIGVDRVDEGK